MRLTITFIVPGRARPVTLHQVEHESADEFRARAVAQLRLVDGQEYYAFERRGYRTPGHVGEATLGNHRRYRRTGQDDMLPGVFTLGEVLRRAMAPAS